MVDNEQNIQNRAIELAAQTRAAIILQEEMRKASTDTVTVDVALLNEIYDLLYKFESANLQKMNSTLAERREEGLNLARRCYVAQQTIAHLTNPITFEMEK